MRRIQDATQQTADLHNIASVYATLGDQTRALEFYSSGTCLATSSQNTRARTASMRAIANILRQQGQAAEALNMDQRSVVTRGHPVLGKTQINVQIVQATSSSSAVHTRRRQPSTPSSVTGTPQAKN